jgi:outer membrane protein TolC
MFKLRIVSGLVAVFLLLPAQAQTVGNADKPVELTVTNQGQAQVAGGPVSLDSLIQEAEQRNPGVQSALRQVQALRHRIPQARTLPDPTVSVGWAGNITPFGVQKGDPSSYRGITASQTIPYPGKLRLRGQVADREAEAAWWDYENARRRLAADVKAAYYDYSFYAKAMETTTKNKDLLQKLSQISEARYRVGKGIQQDVLKSQVEISRIQQRLTVLEQQYKTAQVRLNTLLYRDPEAPLPPPEALSNPKLQYSLDQLYQLAKEHDTGLQREQRMIERNQLAVNLAQRDYYPDFTVAYMYQQRPLMPDMNGLTVTANIPIFYKTKQREAVREATETLISSERSKDNRQTELFFAVKEQYLLAKSAEGLFQLYSQGVVPQSSLALESSMSAYQVGNVDFLTILSNFTTVLDYQIEYYRELANYNMALARLEPLVGMELTK